MTTRTSYHHGDLRNALVRAAASLAATGGPEAITIRGAAREVGVTPTAAYRHFENQAELAHAARDLAMDGMVAAMAGYLGAVPEDGDPVDRALARLESTGRGYLGFALAEPGIFSVCFGGRLNQAEPDGMPEEDPGPYALLGTILDELVEVGWLDAEHRPGAEAGPWSAVHGLALLLIDGPLKGISEADRDRAIDQTLALTVRGLATGPEGRARG
ncbi:TetR/AcrR family transcriptional regulator [Nocardioides caeni]|uniref:TetR/AcrR family transcriptional regulator n=1 Tax=Nocardioides caeni TaxID=574700 RepID=UPI001930FE9B|nr:TetR/AcrR family transcriptional regulator [Nocardioides caeni]